MGSGFESRGVHHRNPVLIGHKPEGGVSFCPQEACAPAYARTPWAEPASAGWVGVVDGCAGLAGFLRHLWQELTLSIVAASLPIQLTDSDAIALESSLEFSDDPGSALQALLEMSVIGIPQAKLGPLNKGWDIQALEAMAVRLLG